MKVKSEDTFVSSKKRMSMFQSDRKENHSQTYQSKTLLSSSDEFHKHTAKNHRDAQETTSALLLHALARQFSHSRLTQMHKWICWGRRAQTGLPNCTLCKQQKQTCSLMNIQYSCFSKLPMGIKKKGKASTQPCSSSLMHAANGQVGRSFAFPAVLLWPRPSLKPTSAHFQHKNTELGTFVLPAL